MSEKVKVNKRRIERKEREERERERAVQARGLSGVAS